MVPAIIQRKLALLRLCEISLRLLWGTARVVALALVLLACCCLIDWIVDRSRDTPTELRLALAIVQVLAFIVMVFAWLLVPLSRRLSDLKLALWVEEAVPSFQHRLISALELNRPHAINRGMSPDLIGEVTREAQELATQTKFIRTLDWHRLYLAFLVAGTPLLLGILAAMIAPETTHALLLRQLLGEADIPRRIHVESITPPIWPRGDAVSLQFRADGVLPQEGVSGIVRIHPEGLPTETYRLEFKERVDDGPAIYVAHVPPSSAPFTFQAWLGDGRSRRLAKIEFETKPALVSQEATLLLPAFCGLRPDGTRYEEPQPRGDIAGLAGSSGRVRVRINKPVLEAAVELLGPGPDGAPGKIIRRLTMDKTALDLAEVQFDLTPQETAYRIILEDFQGFTNSGDAPQRSLSVLADDPPTVTLLPERFPARGQTSGLDDTLVEGVPVPLGKRLRVAYRCASPAGLRDAHFCYRAIPESESAGAPPQAWQTLPLTEVATAAAGTQKPGGNGRLDPGPFDPSRGVFARTGDDDSVDFYAQPSANPDAVPGRRTGGGRLDFQTSALPGLKIGDKLEYYVEVRDQRPTPRTGRSEVRVKEIVSDSQLAAWLYDKLQELERLHQLEDKQTGVFEKAAPGQ